MKQKKTLCVALICALCLGLPVPAVHAAGTYTKPGSSMLTQNWANPVKCHTVSDAKGNVTVMYSVWNGSEQILNIDKFLSSGAKLSHKSVSVPGRTWGGAVFQATDGYNYIATGNDGNTAFYISKYSADWKLIKTASIGKDESYTATAFDGGNCDMAMIGEYLIVHGARGRKDGHQSNVTFFIDTKTMKPTYVTGEFGFDHVSHSFSQFVRSSRNQLFMVDHGDAYPRSVYLQSYETQQTAEGLTQKSGQSLSLMDIWGDTGANYTGTTVDGFELGSRSHIVAGTSIPHHKFTSQEQFEDYEGSNNVYVSVVNKDLKTSSLKWLTSYIKDIQIRNLELVKISDDRFALLYGVEEKGEPTSTCCKLIDSAGNVLKTSTLNKPFYCVSEPSVSRNVLTWCHYVESELGNFLVMNQWNLSTDKFQIFNLDTGMKSKISKLELASERQCVPGKAYEMTVNVYSSAFKHSFPTAPVVWKSSNNDVAEMLRDETILEDSVWNQSYKKTTTNIKVKKAGTAIITCMVGDKTATVKVQAKGPVKKLSFSKKKVTLKLGQSYKAVVSGSNGNKTSWKSSNAKVAKVSKTGTITGLKKGTAKITAAAGGKNAVLTVIVSGKKWIPPKATIISLRKNTKTAMTVKWKKQSGITGYRISYGTNKKLKKAKTITVGKAAVSSKTIKKLKAGKTYYVKVRAYKKAQINGKKTTIYSKWSKTEKVSLK
ncbi:MAG: hypothetical protein HFE75_10520 [Firmicutes bacterium]|nr:hypothetical protein [Bacillota bacterium]